MRDYWAHSSSRSQAKDSRDGWQPLSQHLESVADIAADLARGACLRDERLAEDAALSGLLHDYGKYTDCFQRMLETGRGKCQHAIHGAMLSYLGAESLGAEGAEKGKKTPRYCLWHGQSPDIMPGCLTTRNLWTDD
jgi:hypothetical protein